MNKTEAAKLDAFLIRLSLVDAATVAWFSGWLCADGSIRFDKNSGRPKLRFVITDRDPLLRFAALFGGKVHGPIKPSGLGKLSRFEWQITGMSAVALLKRTLPWLSERYACKAERALLYLPSIKPRKITREQAEIIKAELANGKHGIGRTLALKYGVSMGLISAIRKGRVWS